MWTGDAATIITATHGDNTWGKMAMHEDPGNGSGNVPNANNDQLKKQMPNRELPRGRKRQTQHVPPLLPETPAGNNHYRRRRGVTSMPSMWIFYARHSEASKNGGMQKRTTEAREREKTKETGRERKRKIRGRWKNDRKSQNVHLPRANIERR